MPGHWEKFITPAPRRGSLGLQEQGLQSHQWEIQSQSSVPSVSHWTGVPVLPGVEAQAVHWTAPGDLMLVEMVCGLGLSYPVENSEQAKGGISPKSPVIGASSWETRDPVVDILHW